MIFDNLPCLMGSSRGGGPRGEGTREPWGTLRKLRGYWGHPKCLSVGMHSPEERQTAITLL